jgi:hypothetical protein
MEFVLLCLGVLFLLVCAVQSIFINWNLKEIIVVLCQIGNYQEKQR